MWRSMGLAACWTGRVVAVVVDHRRLCGGRVCGYHGRVPWTPLPLVLCDRVGRVMACRWVTGPPLGHWMRRRQAWIIGGLRLLVYDAHGSVAVGVVGSMALSVLRWWRIIPIGSVRWCGLGDWVLEGMHGHGGSL